MGNPLHEGKTFLKTLWEEEKMLVTSISSFSHNVFYPIIDRNQRLARVICMTEESKYL